MAPRRLLPLLLLASLPALTGCASTPQAERDPLPFTVALIPVRTRVTPPGVGEERGGRTGMELRLDAERVTGLLVEELDQRCFTRTLVLEGAAPAEGTAPVVEASLRDREGAWLEQAERLGADLVVLASLSYDPVVHTSTNDRFWLNLPLFLLGGPMTWFVDDRSYHVDARLEMEVFDLNSFRGANREASLANKNFNVLREGRVLSEVSLDFIDRAGGNVGSYALSILVPSGFLVKESDTVLARLEEAVVTRLGLEVVRAIRERSEELHDSPIVAGFRVEEVRVEDGAVVGRVRLEPSPSAQGMRMVRLSSTDGEPLVEEDLREGREEDGRLVYDVRVPIPAALDLSRVRVEFFDESEAARSYTLDVRAAEAVHRR